MKYEILTGGKMKLKTKILYCVLILAVLSNAIIHVFEIKRLNRAEEEAFGREIINYINMERIEYYLRDHKLALDIIWDLVKKPNFEELLNGTVIIRRNNRRVGGVCVAEDENYYYILTVNHILLEGEERNIIVIPESNMGCAIKLEIIKAFLAGEIEKDRGTQLFTKLMVTSREQEQTYGELLKADKDCDLALLRINKQNINIEVLNLAEKSANVGDGVYIVGHPLQITYNVSKGIVSNISYNLYVIVDAFMTFGNSGGGVFDREGNLIGICSIVPAYAVFELEKDNYEEENNN